MEEIITTAGWNELCAVVMMARLPDDSINVVKLGGQRDQTARDVPGLSQPDAGFQFSAMKKAKEC
jgi:hypothetical protein